MAPRRLGPGQVGSGDPAAVVASPRSRRRSCSSRAPKRSAPNARSRACVTTCAPKIPSLRFRMSAPTPTPPGHCSASPHRRCSASRGSSGSAASRSAPTSSWPRRSRISRSRRKARPSCCATPARACAARSCSTRSAAARAGASRSPCAAVKRDSDRYDFAAGEFQAAQRRIAPPALRALVVGLRRRPHRARGRVSAAHRRCRRRHHRRHRAAVLRRPGRDIRVRRRRHSHRRALRRGARRAAACPGLGCRPRADGRGASRRSCGRWPESPERASHPLACGPARHEGLAG